MNAEEVKALLHANAHTLSAILIDQIETSVRMRRAVQRCVQDRMHTAEEERIQFILREWWKGCSCCEPGKPWQCEQCTFTAMREIAGEVGVKLRHCTSAGCHRGVETGDRCRYHQTPNAG